MRLLLSSSWEESRWTSLCSDDILLAQISDLRVISIIAPQEWNGSCVSCWQSVYPHHMSLCAFQENTGDRTGMLAPERDSKSGSFSFHLNLNGWLCLLSNSPTFFLSLYTFLPLSPQLVINSCQARSDADVMAAQWRITVSKNRTFLSFSF